MPCPQAEAAKEVKTYKKDLNDHTIETENQPAKPERIHSGTAYLLHLVIRDEVDVQVLEEERECDRSLQELTESDYAFFIKQLTIHCLSSWPDAATEIRYTKIVNFLLEEMPSSKTRDEAMITWDHAKALLGKQKEAVQEELKYVQRCLRNALEEKEAEAFLDEHIFIFPEKSELSERFQSFDLGVESPESRKFLNALAEKLDGGKYTPSNFIEIWEKLAVWPGLQAPNFKEFITKMFPQSLAIKFNKIRLKGLKSYSRKLKDAGLFQN